MEAPTYRSDSEVDLSGLRCPHLVIATIEILAPLPSGHILQMMATDLNAPSSVAAWCRQSEHELLSLYLDNGRFIFLIRRGPDPE